MKDFKKRLDSYFIAFCRKAFVWSPAYKTAKQRAEVATDDGVRWKCASCGTLTAKGENHKDHIIPVVPIEGWNGSWDTYRDRMSYEDPGNLQILCIECHRRKSNEENKRRREKRNDEL